MVTINIIFCNALLSVEQRMGNPGTGNPGKEIGRGIREREIQELGNSGILITRNQNSPFFR